MILFLDIDGVLHPDPPQPDQRLRSLPRLVAVLQDFPLVEIVISSLWREHLSLDQLRELPRPGQGLHGRAGPGSA